MRTLEARCHVCQKTVTIHAKHRIDSFKRTGRTYCSPECLKTFRTQSSARTMAATNRRYASARMIARNPMKRADVRARVSTTLRAMKWMPKTRGGNGKPLPLSQLALAQALGWQTEYPVPTKQKRGGEYPTCYKLDIANPDLMIGIEVDGASHMSLDRRQQDRKKETLLRGLGWTVLRFTNKAVTDDLAVCVQTVLSTLSK